MSGRPRKRELDDDSPIVHGNEKTKMRREDWHGQDAASATDQRIIYMEEITRLRWLVYDYVPLKDRGKFEEELDKIGSDDRIVTRQTNNIQGSNDEMANDTVAIPQHVESNLQPLQFQAIEQSTAMIKVAFSAIDSILDVQNVGNLEMANIAVASPQNNDSRLPNLQPLETNEQLTAAIKVEAQAIDSKPDVQNLPAAGDGFLSSSAVGVEPPELPSSGNGLLPSSDVMVQPLQFSNQLKIVAQINFNADLLKKMCDPHKMEGSETVIEELCGLIKQRTTLIKSAQYEYSLIDQHQFNQELVTKLRDFDRVVAPKMKVVFQKLVKTLQWDALDPGQVLCPCYRYLYDIDLLKYIASNSDTVPAQHILRSRKLQLKHLSFNAKSDDIELKLDSRKLVDTVAGICGPTYRKFQYGMHANNVDDVYIFELFNLILQFYDISLSSISFSGADSWKYYHLLESKLGAPPTNHSGKIRVKEMTGELSSMKFLLRWFCPATLIVYFYSELLVETPSLIAGVDVIKCRNMYVCVDRFMEKCTAGVIHLEGNCTWRKESIFRTLHAHRLCAESCPPRQITYRCQGDGTFSVRRWRELFCEWSVDTNTRDPVKIGRNVTMNDNGIDHVTLTLH